MTAKSEASKAIDEAFRAAFLLTGSTEAAENAVLDGIAALEFGHIVDDVLLFETVKSAIQRRANRTSRESFVLRVRLGIPPARCSGVLHLTILEMTTAEECANAKGA